METDLSPRVLAAVDTSEITQLILTERESRDFGHWARMRDCFHDDALIRISWITGDADAFVAGSIDMARRGVLAKHRLGPVRVHLNGDRAVASLSGIIDIPSQVDGIEVHLASHARFLYRAERRDGRWRLSGFDGVYRRDELVPVVPGQVLRVDAAMLAQYRPAYRFLSYVLSRNGYDVNGDLPGEDQPERVAALEKELFGWAG
ncbi:MAG: nuclear transport factor 2 family protein, partial [Pseudomonadota bacterium]